MANKLHSGKVGPWLRPTEQCLLRRFFQALFQPPRLPDPPRSRLRFPIPFFPPFLSPLSFSPPPSLPASLSPLSYSPSVLYGGFKGEKD